MPWGCAAIVYTARYAVFSNLREAYGTVKSTHDGTLSQNRKSNNPSCGGKNSMSPEYIKEIVSNHKGELGALISILEDIQDRYHYLPEEALRIVAGETGRSLVDIYGVATFYKAFSLKPRGKHHISVCMGTACHVRSAPGIVDEFTLQLGLRPGETTQDGEFTLETVNCLGTCALGPIVLADGHYFSNVKRQDVKKILPKIKSGFVEEPGDREDRLFPVEVYCPHCNHSLMDEQNPIEDYPAISLGCSFNEMRGWVRMSSLYGSHCLESEHPIAADTTVKLFCPQCHAELVGKTACFDCGSPMVKLGFLGGGSLLMCTLWGCNNSEISLNGHHRRDEHTGESREHILG